MSLLYDSVIRDKLNFLTRNCLLLQMEEKKTEDFERMVVSPPSHISNLHHSTFIHPGTDALSHIHITIPYVLHCDSNSWNYCVFKLQKAAA
jgi:hypothetical protein